MTNKEMFTLIQNAVDDAEVKTFATGVVSFLTDKDDIAEATKLYVQNKEESAVIAILENLNPDGASAKIVAEKLGVSVPKASAILRRLVKENKVSVEKGTGELKATRIYTMLSQSSVTALLRQLAHFVRCQEQRVGWVIKRRGAGIPL